MRLKRLELFGFKSFADRTVLEFEDSLVGIVGPNGCGKSNVVDALRWVLGEQRAKSMRGGEMTDVIFKGSASRPSMSVAEATVVFDNSSGLIEGRGEEVSVARRVYRTGEGEYLIDGQRVRLKDVREMLYGTGLGSRGYSVLEQGRIDAILSANPLERRTIFEEAAGISRYRTRKAETMSRLDRVQNDLRRLDDVLGELEKRERSLKIQAGKARRFVEARDEWRVEGLRLARHQLHGLDAAIAASGRRQRELEERAEEQRAARTRAEADVHAGEAEQSTLAARAQALSAGVSDLASELSALDERRAQLSARVAAWRGTAEAERGRAAELEQRLEERLRERAELETQRHEVERSAAEARALLERLEASAAQARDAHRRTREESEAENERVLRLLHERTKLENRLVHLERERVALAERLSRADARLEQARAETEAARAAGEEKRAELGRYESGLQELEAERAALEGESATWSELVRGLTEERAGLEVESARLSSRIESLLDREREREGLEQGARALLEQDPGSGDAGLAGELRGLFADHLRAETRHARALDAVLGARAQAIVLADRADAQRAVAWLAAHELGRVHLLFVDPMLHEELPTPAAEALGAEGVEARLVDLVRFAPEFETAARHLLGDVLVVRDLERGLELVRAFPRLRFVTPAGDLIDAAGVCGGHFALAQGAVGRRAFAAELVGERDRVDARLERLAAELADSRAEEQSRKTRLAELQRAIEERGRVRARLESEAEGARVRLAELGRAADLALHEREGLERQAAALAAEEEEARARLEEVRARHDEESARLAGLDALRRELEGEHERLGGEANRARVEATGLQERAEALAARHEDLTRGCEELRLELQRTRRLGEEHEASAVEGEAEAERLAERRLERSAARAQAEEELAALRELERAGRGRMEALRRDGEALTAELEALLAALSDTRLEKQRLELSQGEIRRRACEDFDLDPARVLEGFEPDEALADPAVLDELARRVAELKGHMERLGPVNLEAVNELEEVAGRLGFLRSQRGDLDEARRSLDGTLKRLNAECERLFLETFEQVRENFRLLFRQLFGGGKADVELQAGASVLEAGIEITARPPGRELLPITLLSGGQRTLTALAMLFALFRAKPSPFCVLDEVDAALDDANIGRFLGMLQHTHSGTQFIVVTHNKGTMSACELLYGVTMAIKGVSKVVSVELEDVDEFVPEATGSVPTPGDVLVPLPPPSSEAAPSVPTGGPPTIGQGNGHGHGNGNGNGHGAPDEALARLPEPSLSQVLP